MSRYKSEQTAYNPLKKKYVPLWSLDTNSVNITHLNPDTLTEESKTYHTDFIGYHLHFSDSHCHCPDRLRRLVNEEKSYSTLMIWNWKSEKLSLARWNFGSRPIFAIKRLFSQKMSRRWLVLKTASSVWRGKLCLIVWLIFDVQRLWKFSNKWFFSILFSSRIFPEWKVLIYFLDICCSQL